MSPIDWLTLICWGWLLGVAAVLGIQRVREMFHVKHCRARDYEYDIVSPYPPQLVERYSKPEA